jgi:hypothetical protein
MEWDRFGIDSGPVRHLFVIGIQWIGIWIINDHIFLECIASCIADSVKPSRMQSLMISVQNVYEINIT